MFNLNKEYKDTFDFHTLASFGEIIKTPDGKFGIELSNNTNPDKNLEGVLKFIFHSRKKLIESYSKRMKVEKYQKREQL